MLDLLYLLAFIMVAYYLWANWVYLKDQPLILGALIAGAILLFSSIFLYAAIKYAALARFTGILLIVIGMGINVFKGARNSDQ